MAARIEPLRTGAPKTWGVRLLILSVIAYMGVLILAPILALIEGAWQNGFPAILTALVDPALRQSLLVSLQIALGVVAIQAVLGTLTAWVIVRHNFLGRALLNGLIDIPFAISPVVVGYMLLLLFGRNGLLGPLMDRFDLQVAFALPGMFLATLFVSLPFMIREMVPVIENLDRQQEHAAATLGAGRWTIFRRITLPPLRNALIYGMTLTLARALGEFGAVLVIGGGVQGRTETTTLYIFRALDERQYVEAYTAAILLGLFSISIVYIADWLRHRSE